MSEYQKLLDAYNYEFPNNLIANEPASPRDSAKLLIYNKKTNKINFDTFKNITKYLPKNAVMVFNETKVVPARLILKKITGGKVRVLYIAHDNKNIKVLADRKLEPGSIVTLNKSIYFIVVSKKEQFYFLQPSFDIKNIFEVLEKYGKTPIPPYIKNSPLKEKDLKEKYQTVFANIRGSVAAPTASLHFTDRLMKKIKKHGVDIKFVTLHVNMGTFAPLTEDHVKTQKLHEEFFEIKKETADFLNKAKKAGRPIIAVGTTVVRTLESSCGNNLVCGAGTTQLFIKENYKHKFVDGIVTNFHVPKSSLLMLVSSFVTREKLFEIYKKAIHKKFKLFSFGDGMFVI